MTTQLVQGTNITLSPTAGIGVVTINATAGGSESSTYGNDGSSKTFKNAVLISSGGLTVNSSASSSTYIVSITSQNASLVWGARGDGTVKLLGVEVSSRIALNTPKPQTVYQSSATIGIWMINESSRTITEGEIVQDSSGTALSLRGAVGVFAASTTTIMGVATNAAAAGQPVFVAQMGQFRVWCGVASLCNKGTRVIGIVNGPQVGRASGVAAPAAGASIGVWMETTAINTRGWVRMP